MQHDTIDKSSSWSAGFVSGLVCGEGNFTITITKSKFTRLGYHVRAMFQIEMNRSDEALLLSVKDFFGFGSVYYHAPRAETKSPTCRYAVTSINENLLIVNFFRANPLVGVKQKSFEVWAKCLELMSKGEHNHSEGFNRIQELREGISPSKRPPTFRKQICDANSVTAGRRLSSWTPAEVVAVERYVQGEMSRIELMTKVSRDGPSLNCKISRVRKAMQSQLRSTAARC